MDHNNAWLILADDYSDFIFLILSGKESHFNTFSGRESQRYRAIEKTQSSELIKDYCRSEIELHWALLNWRYGNYLKSGTLMRKAYKRLVSLQEKYPDFIEVNKSLGTLHILLSAIPEEYNWLINLFGFENNYQRGLSELKRASENPNPFQNEAKLLSAYVEHFVTDNNLDFSHLEKQIDPDLNKLNSMVYMIICHKSGYNEAGLKEINKEKWLYNPRYISSLIYILRGEFYLKKLDYEEAEWHFKNFQLSYEGKSFKSNARLKLFYCLYLRNDQKAETVFKEGAAFNDDQVISDSYAEKFFKDGELPNKILLKSRLLFDGGYYQEAMNEIQLFKIQSNDKRSLEIEYYYRLGRIYQKLNEDNLALKSFEKCIEIQDKENLYFAPNSCLQLGKHFKAKNNYEKARFYYKKALEYKNYAYKRSIDHQAKSALNTLP